ncbi:unnamed protein product, partial [Mesorhabditis spiculigera]
MEGRRSTIHHKHGDLGQRCSGRVSSEGRQPRGPSTSYRNPRSFASQKTREGQSGHLLSVSITVMMKRLSKRAKTPGHIPFPTKRFITEVNANGVKIVTGLEVVEIEWEKDAKGAWKMVEKPVTTWVEPVDMVILAMGFTSAPSSRLQLYDLNDAIYKTNVEKVFSAGDSRRGQSLVVWAIHEGRQARSTGCGRAVLKYLMKRDDKGKGLVGRSTAQPRISATQRLLKKDVVPGRRTIRSERHGPIPAARLPGLRWCPTQLGPSIVQ